MSFIDFPNVPNVPGVPAIARSITVPTPQALEVGAVGALTDLLGFTAPVWGVFDQSGNKALNPDSFLAFEYKNSSRVSDYPQEQGAFASYNKVATPFDVRVRMSIGSDLAARTDFLATCDTMLKSTDLFNVVTPEATYVNVTLDNYDYRREQKNGATLITVELSFVEIRITATAQFSSGASSTPLAADQVQSPSAADPVSDGQVQAFAVPPGIIDVTDFQ
jgi:hypothetical protein